MDDDVNESEKFGQFLENSFVFSSFLEFKRGKSVHVKVILHDFPR